MFSVIENSLNLDAVKLDALYPVKLIFGEYFCYFDSNCVAVLLQLHLYSDTNRVLVRERVNRVWVWVLSTAVSELTLGVNMVLTMFGVTYCFDGERTLRATGASVGVVVIAEDVAFTFLVAFAYDNFSVFAKS